MLGTKCPSITSRWIQSAPAASTARTSSPSFEKSEARIEGAMKSGRGMIPRVFPRPHNILGRAGQFELTCHHGVDTSRQRLEKLRHQIDRELRHREIEPGHVRHEAAGGREHQAHIAAARAEGERQRLLPAGGGEDGIGDRAKGQRQKNARTIRPSTSSGFAIRAAVAPSIKPMAKTNNAITLMPSIGSFWRRSVPCRRASG